jgi:hypothetical protein
MKKIITFMTLSLVSFMLLVSTGQSVFAFDPDTDPYEDLFYESTEHSIDLTVTEGVASFDDYPTYSDLEEYLLNIAVIDVLNHDVVTNFDNLSINIDDTFDRSSLTIREGYIGFNFVNESNLEYRIEFNESNEVPIVDDGDLPLSDGSYTISFTTQIPIAWSQSYSYGRVRSYDLDLGNQPGMTYDAANERVWIGFEDASNLNFDVRNFDLGDYSEFGALAAWQSPYKNFRVVAENGTTIIEEWEDVAAVVYEAHTNGEVDPRGSSTLTVYYWVDGSIVTDTLDDLDLERAYFYGGVRQAITGEEHMVANVDNLTPLEDFLQYIVAWDDLLGDISDQVVIADDGGYQPDVVGVYDVIFSVTDSEGNESTLEASVHVVDIVAPVITGVTTPITISYHETFDVSAWVESLTVTDNYYTGLTVSIQTNTYSSNKTNLGTYQITVRSFDPSGNVGTLTRTITVVDGVGPVFSGLSTLTVSISENITVEQIKAALVATDAKDGNVTSSIVVDSDELTGNNQIPGTYTVVFKATDSAGNQTFKTVTVTINSAPPGMYLIDGSTVRLLPGATLTIEQILDVLGVTEGYTELSTNYNPDLPGVYQLSFTYNDETFNINITVLGEGENPLPAPPIPELPNNTSSIIWITVGVILVTLSIGGIILLRKKKTA